MSDALVPMLRLDLRSLVATGRSWLLFGAIVVLVPMFAGADMAVPMAAVGGTFVGMSLFSLDETHRLRLLYGGLPVSRRTVIVSHYLVSAVGVAVFVLVGVVVALAAGSVRGGVPDALGLAASSGLGLLLALMGVLLPLYLRFGARAGSVVAMSVMMLAIGLGVALNDVLGVRPVVGEARAALEAAGPWVVVAMPVVGLALLGVSCLVSIGIYERQDH